MGTRASRNGVTLRILDKDGVEQRQVFGKFAQFYSRKRPLNPGSPDPLLGSQDWLTDILVADTQDRLDDLEPTQTELAATSKGSRLVLVQWNVGDEDNQMEDCLTLCKGTMEGNLLFTDEVRVLPKETIMDKNHRLFPDWEEAAHFLQNL